MVGLGRSGSFVGSWEGLFTISLDRGDFWLQGVKKVFV